MRSLLFEKATSRRIGKRESCNHQKSTLPHIILFPKPALGVEFCPAARHVDMNPNELHGKTLVEQM